MVWLRWGGPTHWGGYGHARERDRGVAGRDRSEGRQTGCEGDRKRKHDAVAHVRFGHHFDWKGGVYSGRGWTGDESDGDGQGAVRQCECGDGWCAERAEQYERDVGVQR